MVSSSRGAILVAAGDIDAQQYLETALLSQGFSVELADNGEDVCNTIRAANPVSLVLLDQRMGIVSEIRRIDRRLPIVVMTGGAAAARSSQKLLGEWNGHDHVLTLSKPVFYDDLAQAIAELVPDEPDVPQEAPVVRPYFEFSVQSQNPRMRQIGKLIEQAARSEVPVLVQGETGVGKEMLVREIHARSRRAGRPFVNINCAALPKELVESQLFGHERGAFTGAHRSQPGLFEVADGGTILLDEIGDMDIRLQAKLLQVLQDNEFHRLGGGNMVRVDVRVMAATHRDLSEAVASGRMRADLYYRLKVVSILIPPMRERRDEIIPLAEFFLKKHSFGDAAPPEIDLAVKRHLLSYHWPGNVRELENMIRRYLVLRDSGVFQDMRPAAEYAEDPGPRPAKGERGEGHAIQDRSIFDSLDQTKRQAQVDALVAALNASQWNRKKAADLLRLDYKQLLYQMKKLQVEGANRRTRSRSGPKHVSSRPLKAERAVGLSDPWSPVRQLS
jgi:two-component system response regulator AtoC